MALPRHSKLVVERLLEVLTRGAEALHPAALLALRCLFEVPELDLGAAARSFSDAQLFFPVAALLDTPCSALALEVGFICTHLLAKLAGWRVLTVVVS